MTFPAHVFREYDIRGLADVEIDAHFAYRLGRAFADMLSADTNAPVIVGRDVRLSGPALQAAAMAGISDAGRDILDIGVTPTPLAYFSVFRRDAAGCLQVTASHNPGEYNGFKMMRGRESLHGGDLQQLMQRMQDAHDGKTMRQGHCRTLDIIGDYIDAIADDCRPARPLKVAIDAGNGPSGIVAAPFYRRLGCEVVELYCEPDGRFPHHHPDPSIADNLHDLAACVRARHCDLGIAFDGDGDRIGVVDENGRIIPGDMLLLLLARPLLQQHPGATIISEVKASCRLYRGIREAGGRPLMWRTGHSPIKAKMRETGALLAGEMSGHMFFADRFFGFDDATYAAARIMQVLAAQNGPLSTLLQDVPPMLSTPEIRIACNDAEKFAIVDAAIAHFRARGYHIITIDGMRLELNEDCWGLLRASNTQPVLVMRFEAPDTQQMQHIRGLIERWLEQHLPA